MEEAPKTVHLKPDTLLAFIEHIQEAEAAIEQTLSGDHPFLWADGCAERIGQVRSGLTIAQLWSGKKPIRVPDGLVHDWVGATCIAGATLDRALALVQDYDNHKNIYKPEVIDSKLISRHGDDFQIYLRLMKRRIITVVLDTYHDVHYSHLDSTRACPWRIDKITRRLGCDTNLDNVAASGTSRSLMEMRILPQ